MFAVRKAFPTELSEAQRLDLRAHISLPTHSDGAIHKSSAAENVIKCWSIINPAYRQLNANNRDKHADFQQYDFM